MDKLKKDWTESLAERMEAFAETEPEGLWDAVSSGVHGRGRRKPAPIWWYDGAALAAAAVLAIVLILHPSMPQEGVSIVPGDAVAAENISEESPFRRTPVFEMETGKTEELLETAMESAGTITKPVETKPVETAEELPETDDAETEPAPSTRQTVQTWPQERKKKQQHIRVHGGISTGGLFAGNVVQTSSGYGLSNSTLTKAVGTGAVFGTSSPAMLARNRESTTTSDHRQSARLSLDLCVSITDRLSVGTGLVFTSLTSSFDSKAGGSRSHLDRSLSYYGIPLYVQYNLLQWKRFTLYANAGPMLEFCSGGEEKNILYLGTTEISRASNTIDYRDSRWSLDAGAGIQLKIFGRSSLFVQPGFSWHLPGNREFESYYTEHPAAFNFTVGYRVNLF